MQACGFLLYKLIFLFSVALFAMFMSDSKFLGDSIGKEQQLKSVLFCRPSLQEYLVVNFLH